MKINQPRFVKFAAISLAAILLLTLLMAPHNNKVSSGSTYGRSPDSYSAWYDFMTTRGTPVQRWQKPLTNLTQKYDGSTTTLLRVFPSLKNELLDFPDPKWLEKGNYLVILGVKENPTPANFENIYNHEVGIIKIDTTRRNKLVTTSPILGDKFGAIVWSKPVGKGKIIYSTTPDLAANAYQDFPGNYQLLAKIATENQHQVVVDEYIHGYKDPDLVATETGRNFIDYLAQTPLLPAFIQILIVLIIAILAHNFRFGQTETLTTPTVNNSAAYIQALGGVLQKAEARKFIIETIGKREQQKLQRELGLGDDLVTKTELVEAWKQETGKPNHQLEEVIFNESQSARIREADLMLWLEKWREIHRYFVD